LILFDYQTSIITFSLSTGSPD